MFRTNTLRFRTAPGRILHLAATVILLMVTGCMPANAESNGNANDGTEELVEMVVGDHTFHVEIADTDESRAQGLMHRESLPADQGMLFVFDRDQRLSFWMKNTSIPLSIAYISSDGVIREIRDMEPYDLTPVRSQRSVRYALEVNQGAFEEAGISEGDSVEIPAEYR